MKIVTGDGKEFELIQIEYSNFARDEPKSEIQISLLPYKEGWNDPDNTYITRTYKGIKIGDKYYGLKPINK